MPFPDKFSVYFIRGLLQLQCVLAPPQRMIQQQRHVVDSLRLSMYTPTRPEIDEIDEGNEAIEETKAAKACTPLSRKYGIDKREQTGHSCFHACSRALCMSFCGRIQFFNIRRLIDLPERADRRWQAARKAGSKTSPTSSPSPPPPPSPPTNEYRFCPHRRRRRRRCR